MRENVTIAVYTEPYAAEEAVRRLQKAGFDMKNLSIVGKDFETEEQVVGFYNIGDRVKYLGGMGAFWGGLWGQLGGAAFLSVPGIGLITVGGPIVIWMVVAVEAKIVGGGLSTLWGALYSMGIPQDSIMEYETALKAGKFLLVAQGNAEEVDRARVLLLESDVENLWVRHATAAGAGLKFL